MSRHEAGELWKRRADFEKVGARMVAIVKEDIGDELTQFEQAVWQGGDIFLDNNLHLFNAIWGMMGFLWKVMTGRVLHKAKAATAAGYKGTNIGEGLGKGGMYIVKKGGEPVFTYQEQELGTHADLEAMVRAAQGVLETGGARGP